MPNFIIIGAQKCGTSSLHNYLDQHPDIQMSIEKEVQYFSEEYRWELGLDWYKKRFPEGHGLKGEASPQYTWYPHYNKSAERMAALLPDIKLIYMVRDPITRMASQYQDWVAQFWERGSFEDAMTGIEQPSHRYRATSSYWSQLEQYLKYYKPEQIKVVTLEDLSKDTAVTMRGILEFLEVDSKFYSQSWLERTHTGDVKRRPHRLFQPLVNDWLRMELLEPRRIPAKLATSIRNFIQYTGTPIERPHPEGELEQQLINIFHDEVKQLRQFTGQQFERWRAY
ncbi:MAG: sulfotransferase [Gammaproteobacteria bacterium]|nr:sulfotransferase [Gammaproteobacteria bacterium]